LTTFGAYEWDETKNASNLAKHGISFADVTEIWSDLNLAQLKSRDTEIDEQRFLCIGKIDQTIWSCIITYRQQRIRIMSARRSSKLEIKVYEKK
jgi:uncharacterized DUF497 family protein